jgi:molecular chaperone IbpA
MEDVTMRTFDFDPFRRTSVGFDRLFNLMDESLRMNPEEHFPPYNIARLGEDKYQIALAVAGFKPEEISIIAQQNTLAVSGKIQKQDDAEYLHRGIAARSFERRFNLADYVEVTGAKTENGLLLIDLERRIPEAMKPRRIEIAGEPANNVTSIEQVKAA